MYVCRQSQVPRTSLSRDSIHGQVSLGGAPFPRLRISAQKGSGTPGLKATVGLYIPLVRFFVVLKL